MRIITHVDKIAQNRATTDSYRINRMELTMPSNIHIIPKADNGVIFYIGILAYGVYYGRMAYVGSRPDMDQFWVIDLPRKIDPCTGTKRS